MKKKEIMAFMDAQIILDKKDTLSNDRMYSSSYAALLMEDGKLVPDNIPELKEELNTLRDEMIRTSKKAKEAQELIKSIKCTHDVRLTDYGFGDIHYCVFCGERIYGENYYSWRFSRYRNAHCVNLVDHNQSEADICGGYTLRQAFKIIKDIIKDKDDEDEIDLVEEFSKLNLNGCEINNKKVYPETFIMIIGGTNTYKFSPDVFVTRAKLEISKTICDFFAGLLDTKVLLIDNPDITKQIKEIRDLEIKSYSSKKELNHILKEYKQDFKLIIDISELFAYRIKSNKVTAKEVDLKLKEKYPNAKIIKIKNFNKHSMNEIEAYLNRNTEDFVYHDEKYYFSDEGKCKSTSEEKAFQKIKSKM